MSKPSYNFIDATFYFFKVFGARPLSVAWIAVWQINSSRTQITFVNAH